MMIPLAPAHIVIIIMNPPQTSWFAPHLNWYSSKILTPNFEIVIIIYIDTKFNKCEQVCPLQIPVTSSGGNV